MIVEVDNWNELKWSDIKLNGPKTKSGWSANPNGPVVKKLMVKKEKWTVQRDETRRSCRNDLNWMVSKTESRCFKRTKADGLDSRSIIFNSQVLKDRPLSFEIKSGFGPSDRSIQNRNTAHKIQGSSTFETCNFCCFERTIWSKWTG